MRIKIIGLCLLLLCNSVVSAVYNLAGDDWTAVINERGRLQSYNIDSVEFLRPFPGGAEAMLIRRNQADLEFSTVRRTENGAIVAENSELRLTYIPSQSGLTISYHSLIRDTITVRWRVSEAVTRAYDSEDDTFVDPVTTWYDDMVGARLVTESGPMLIWDAHTYWTREPYTAAGAPCLGFTIYPRNQGEWRLLAQAKPPAKSALVFLVDAENPDFLPPGSGVATFPCTAENLSGTSALDFSWEVALASFPTLHKVSSVSGTSQLSAGETKKVPIAFKLSDPGVYRAAMTIRFADGDQKEKTWNFCYNFADWQPECAKADDFEAFWQKTLEELAAVPVDLKLTEISRGETSTLYKLNFAVLDEFRCFAWLRIPAGEENEQFPARLELPPSGVSNMPPPREDRFVEMKIAIHGFDVDRSDFPDKPPYPWPNGRYHNVGLADPETYFFRNVYARCWRAVDILAAMPEVDPERIMVYGGSQGGGLAVVTAAFRPNVALCAPGIPGLCRLDWTVKYGIGSWPLSRDDVPDGQTLEQMLETLSYYDVANFVGRVRCPIVVSVGWMDTVTAAAGQVAAFAQADKDRLTIFGAPWGRHGSSSRTQQLYFGAHREFAAGKAISLPKTWLSEP